MQIEAGLGLSEEFYSWIITIFNFGALIGAIGTGILVKIFPFWHMIMSTLICHTAGYILYALSYEKSIIILSKLLSGVFIGGEMTLSLSYFAISAEKYNQLQKELGRKQKPDIARGLFAWHNIGVGVGYIIGPGKHEASKYNNITFYGYMCAGTAALIAQFNVDQFRTIAWFNVVFGVALALLQIAIFSDTIHICKEGVKPTCFNEISKKKWKISRLEIFIS